jgi:hypothetical protein
MLGRSTTSRMTEEEDASHTPASGASGIEMERLQPYTGILVVHQRITRMGTRANGSDIHQKAKPVTKFELCLSPNRR